MRSHRQVVNIDEEKCTGCGDCIVACAEGAIEIIDGKAKLVSDIYCDGLGACLGICPEGAITVEGREAEAFDEEAVRDRLATLWAQGKGGGVESPAAEPPGCPSMSAGCPSAQLMEIGGAQRPAAPRPDNGGPSGGLYHWPIKLGLVPPGAPFLEGADVMLAADCVAFAYPDLHREFLPNGPVLIGCPKFDNIEFAQNRLTEILRGSVVRSLTVLHMEVPCCFGYWRLAQQACAASGKEIPLREVTIGVRGDVKQAGEAPSVGCSG